MVTPWDELSQVAPALKKKKKEKKKGGGEGVAKQKKGKHIYLGFLKSNQFLPLCTGKYPF